MVSEAGASVYSASAYASQELPELDVSLRGAVSIARRLQDPLAELVKIDPKSIGVGQYQHDLSEVKLSRSLDAVVEDCVNAVGVDVNTASAPLLTRVSGHRLRAGREHRAAPRRQRPVPYPRRRSRRWPRLGPKAFEQCAGFLRIPDGDDPLDASSVHPEAYPVVRRILAATGADVKPSDRQQLGCCARCGRPTSSTTRSGCRRSPTSCASWRSRAATRVPRSRRRPSPTGVEKVADLTPGMVLGGRRHQRGGVRRVRRRRRAPGRPGARVGDVEELRQGPARGGQVRATSSGSRCWTWTYPASGSR